jgi:hypothetical protein
MPPVAAATTEQRMFKSKEGRIVETPMEARQAEPGPSVLPLLVISVALATIFLGWYLADFLRQVRARFWRAGDGFPRGRE